jgi:hypothetical protein
MDMPRTFPMLDRAGDASAPIRIRLIDGSEAAASLRLLSNDGCELESDKKFRSGQKISIHLYRMGWVRARITSCRSRVIEAEFLRECAV